MILSWALFPIVLAALGLGWGSLVEWACGSRAATALTIPLGLAAVICVAALLTAFSPTAAAAAPVAAAGGLAGLARAWRRTRIAPAAAVAAIGVLAIYGAPVLLSGQDTFLGYVRLDDTATWLAFTDQFLAHGRSLGSLPISTYQLLLSTNLTGSGYPSGAFMLLGVGHWITGIDGAWIFQPYEAACASALALCSFELLEPIAPSAWLRAFVSFIGAQSALLFAYAAWGGIKELTAAFLLALGIALAARLLREERPSWRAPIALGVGGAALIVTLGGGAAVYIGPALLAVAGVVGWRALRHHGPVLAYLTALPVAAVLSLPAWLTVSAYLNANKAFGDCSPITTTNRATCFGNLFSPLRGLQVAGIWLYGDFRDFPAAPPGLANHLLIWLVFAGTALLLGWSLWRRTVGPALYVAVALVSLAVLSIESTGPWVMGKALAISSPAVLLAGLAGGAVLFSRRHVVPAIAGILLLGAIAGGVLWSNYLQYRDVTLAPRARLAELQTIGTMVGGHGPTFLNEYEIYGDRHFLRAGAPVEPEEYRDGATESLPTLGNAILTKPAWANIDSFGLNTLAPFRSLVTRVGPTESLPPSIYKLVWHGRYYQLWQQPARATLQVISHTPLGDSLSDAFCGVQENGPSDPLCPIAPASVPSCPAVRALGRTAARDGAELRAYERTDPIVLRGTDTQWGSGWNESADGSKTLRPTAAGATATAHVNIPFGVRGYQLWLGGSFTRGFDVAVDGRHIGRAADQLEPTGGFAAVGKPLTLKPGVHTITITYPKANLSPGNADLDGVDYDALTAIALSPPLYPARGAGTMLTVPASRAASLCGRTLDWIEVVKPAVRPG
jgi:hypothetical protein